MALTHTTAIRNGIADYVTGQIDTGGAGTLQFQTSGDVEVATVTFSVTAFGAASGGTCTSAAITQDSDAAGGTVAKFRIYNGSATEILSGNVLTSGGDLNMASLVINPGDIITCTGGITYSAPA